MKRALLWLSVAMAAQAHVGSPDVFFEGSAGPYRLFVTLRPPSVIPGVTEVEIRSSSPDIREIRVAPTPLTGSGANLPPTPDVLQRSKLDPQFFTGAIWIMATNTWQVRIQVDGAQGTGRLSVPLVAVATTAKPMQLAMGAFLFVMMLVLVAGIVSIVGAAAREGQLAPGAEANAVSKRRARILMASTAAIVVLVLWGGNHWWSAEASSYAGNLYKPMAMTATVDVQGKLTLSLKNPPWSIQRLLSDFLPDHGHLMHLYMIHEPNADRAWHLHPEMTAPGVFTHALPPVPAGRYKLYADVVHRSGFAETMTAELTLDHDLAGTPISGDDAAGSRGAAPDGVRITWDRPATIHARALIFSNSGWSIKTEIRCATRSSTWVCSGTRRSSKTMEPFSRTCILRDRSRWPRSRWRIRRLRITACILSTECCPPRPISRMDFRSPAAIT